MIFQFRWYGLFLFFVTLFSSLAPFQQILASHAEMGGGHDNVDMQQVGGHEMSSAGHDMSEGGHMAANADEKINFEAFDRDQAFQYSQAVIGKKVSNYHFTDTTGNRIALSEFAGQPLVISLIYTSCYHICPTTTKYLGKVAENARAAMPDKPFTLLTIGFDTPVDTPSAMGEFKKKQGGVGNPDWHFLSADQATIDALAKDLGFIFYPSPQGFNHLVQATLVDAERVIYRQVYGMKFDPPILVEPLKQLLFNRPSDTLAQALADKIRFFCTVYDPSRENYRFDYSIFIGIFIGVMSCLVMGIQLVKEWRRSIKAS